MRKKRSFSAILICLMVISLFGMSDNRISAETIDMQEITNPLKPWTITFNKPVSSNAENLQKVRINSTKSHKYDVSTKVSADSHKVIVVPEKPYLFGTIYTLVIDKKIKSSEGTELITDVTKTFVVKGVSIQSITAIANPLVTNIIVKGDNTVSTISLTINQSNEQVLIKNGIQFSKGIQGLIKGDYLTIKAFDTDKNLIETQHYEVN